VRHREDGGDLREADDAVSIGVHRVEDASEDGLAIILVSAALAVGRCLLWRRARRDRGAEE